MSSKERTDAHRRKKANISPDCVNLQVKCWMLTDCVLTAVKPSGSSFTPGSAQVSTAHVRVLDSSREGNLKTVFWRNQVQHSGIQYRGSGPALIIFNTNQNRKRLQHIPGNDRRWNNLQDVRNS
ncbi:hypothetical protein AMECASPLE_027287 [Ameca splendens]|uniref:Uncharacterized protein n=1 Tax=Ameca splendens TaxID=208324 RepID=A0ABV0YSR8_9TELE